MPKLTEQQQKKLDKDLSELVEKHKRQWERKQKSRPKFTVNAEQALERIRSDDTLTHKEKRIQVSMLLWVWYLTSEMVKAYWGNDANAAKEHHSLIVNSILSGDDDVGNGADLQVGELGIPMMDHWVDNTRTANSQRHPRLNEDGEPVDEYLTGEDILTNSRVWSTFEDVAEEYITNTQMDVGGVLGYLLDDWNATPEDIGDVRQAIALYRDAIDNEEKSEVRDKIRYMWSVEDGGLLELRKEVCPECGTEFTPKHKAWGRRQQLTCGNRNCYERYQRKLAHKTLTCVNRNCSNEFTQTHGSQKFCSPKCRKQEQNLRQRYSVSEG
jgi:hypothetical protein